MIKQIHNDTIRAFTIDASVFLNAFNPSEQGHEVSAALLDLVRKQRTPIVEPTLLLPEVAGVVARMSGDEALAQAFTAELREFLRPAFVDLDLFIAERAQIVASRYRLRGSDAVYVAVAQHFGAALITLDRQQKERAQRVIATFYPDDLINSS